MHDKKTQISIAETHSAKFTLMWIDGQKKIIMSERFELFETAMTEFNRKPNASRVIFNDSWEIKNSKSISKKNKVDLKRLKEHIAILKKHPT